MKDLLGFSGTSDASMDGRVAGAETEETGEEETSQLTKYHTIWWKAWVVSSDHIEKFSWRATPVNV